MVVVKTRDAAARWLREMRADGELPYIERKGETWTVDMGMDGILSLKLEPRARCASEDTAGFDR